MHNGFYNNDNDKTNLNDRLRRLGGSNEALQRQTLGSPTGSTTPAYAQRPQPNVTIKGPTPEELKAALDSKVAATEKAESGIAVRINKSPISTGEKIEYTIEKRTAVTMTIEDKDANDEIAVAKARVDELIAQVEQARRAVEAEQINFDSAKRNHEIKSNEFMRDEEKRAENHRISQEQKKQEHERKFKEKHEKWKSEKDAYDARQAKKREPDAALKAVAATLKTDFKTFKANVTLLRAFIKEQRQEKGPNGLPFAALARGEGGAQYAKQAILSSNSKTLEQIIKIWNKTKDPSESEIPNTSESRLEMTQEKMNDLMKWFDDKTQHTNAEDIKQTVEEVSVPYPEPEPQSETFVGEKFESRKFEMVQPSTTNLDNAKKRDKELSDELKKAGETLEAIKTKPTSRDVVSHIDTLRLGNISYNTEKQRVDINFKSHDSNDIKEVVESVKDLRGQVRIHNAANNPDLSAKLATQALLTLGRVPEFDPPWPLTLDQKPSEELKKLCAVVKENIDQYIKDNANSANIKPEEIAKLKENYNSMLKDNGIPLKELEYAVTPASAQPADDQPLVFTSDTPSSKR